MQVTELKPTPEQEIALNWLYAQLKGAKSEVNGLRKAYTNGLRYGADQRFIEEIRRDYPAAVEEYNRLVAQINELTAPFRAQQQEQRRAAAQERKAAQEKQRKAELRAATCSVCGLVHAGEC